MMAIAGIESIVPPQLPGAAIWAELIYVAAAPIPYMPPLPGSPPPQLGAAPIAVPIPTQWTGLLIHRELLDPTAGYTIMSATHHFGYDPTSTTPYAMDWTSKILQLLLWTDTLDYNMTMVLIEGDIAGGTDRLTQVMLGLPPILPYRTVWPIWPGNNPRPIPSPVFNPLPALHPVAGSLS